MALRLPYDVLRQIFRHLNGQDLRSTSQICRIWWDAAHDENYSRGPVGNIFGGIYYINFLESVERFLKEHFPINLSFHIIFIFKQVMQNSITGCLCKYLPVISYKLLIEIFYHVNNSPAIVSLSLPDSYKIQVNTYSFLRIENTPMIMIPELLVIISPTYNIFPSMRNRFVRYFNNNSPMKTAMILLCEVDQMNLLKDLVKQLVNWFPNSNVPIWGGITKKMIICGKYSGTQNCSNPLSCIFFFISRRNSKIWNISFPPYIVNMESGLRAFVKSVQLQKHSFGFIYVADYSCPNFKGLECKLFEKFFPNTPYVYYYGPASFSENGLQDVLRKIISLELVCANSSKVYSNTETSMMIITYS